MAQREEAEELMQPKAIQHKEEEEPIQGKFEAASSAQLKEEAVKPNNTGLPDNLKSGIVSLSGMSMDNVRVHYNSSQPAQLNALAYAQGTDIHVAPGQERHLPHEAWHVVQQAQGRVQPTMQMKEGVPVNDDQSLEHEADVMGRKAATAPLQGTSVQAKSDAEIQSGFRQPAQLVRPKPLNEMLATRMTRDSDHGRETEVDVQSGANADDVLLAVYREARDHNLNIAVDNLLANFHQYVPRAIEFTQTCVRIAQERHSGDENAQAQEFDTQFGFVTNTNDNISAVMMYFYKKSSSQAAADSYLTDFVAARQNFDFGFSDDEGVQYRTPRAGFFGPSQLSLNIGTSTANRILREAFRGATEEAIFTHIAVGIQHTKNTGIDALSVAAGILEQYLQPKIMQFVYRLPLAERANNDNVWGGLTLHDGIQYEDGRDLEVGDTWVYPKVRTAWGQIRDIVAPAVLNHAGRVRVRIDGAIARAFYSDALIHVGWLQAGVGTVMHEFGHHLEDKARVPRWIKLQQLLRDRSGNELTRIFPFTIPYVISRNEMRYDTSFPASGEMGGCFGYNVKYYEHGSTEVVSTTFEVFHNPEKAYSIAIKDPAMFLAVMGVLRDR
ncbi:MAG: DUF4157 domain-containing protein [Nitrosomonas oligotropha]|uniref:DUF4157 domain-containing protein n=1 Tax=Nitrosomonas oligotropha TaxID=42354 RepID=A0A5C7VRF5_9PROT|nr:MAG: DUF4157 domain-containing protein [Nitrosomonas oligotropha]